MTNGHHEADDNPAGAPVLVDGTAVNLLGNSGQVDGTLPLKEAAAVLGVSERTLRRRIKDNQIQAFKVPTAQGYEWRVQVDGTPGQPDTPPTRQTVNLPGTSVQVAGTAPSSPELLRALDLVDRLQRDNQQLAGQVGFLQARTQELERTIALLTAAKPDPTLGGTEQEPPKAEPPPQAKRSRWQRIIEALSRSG